MDSLVSTDWLAREIGAGDLRILDASYHLPDAGRDAAQDYARGHIPGAMFLDLATLVDIASPIDNTMPPPDRFAARMRELGVSEDSRIVVYDDSAIHSAARAWFMLRLFGARQVAILDGGLGKWQAEGRPLAQGSEAARAGDFTARPAQEKLRDKGDMLRNLEDQREQVIDARGPGRFTGAEKESRPGLASGHIPGARNLPYATLYQADGTCKPSQELAAAFADAGIDPARPVVTSCGSGMTACILAFALHRLGHEAVALYDGSWSEWGADPGTPKATGPA
jgi:thiosulfate/3-mercaptopyruvate sulfurtransferase